jgi:diguanylate cyclase (GGDEF)-like protein
VSDAGTGPTGADRNEIPVVEYRGEELAILFDTINDLISTLSIREVIERLLQRVLVHLESEIASILMVGPDAKLRIRHARGLPEEIVESTCLGLGEGISGYVAQAGSAVLIEDIEQDPRFRRRNHERYYTRSAISVPLRIHGNVMGVINVNNKQNRESYAADDLRLVEAIAGHAAVALFNARRFEETLERAQHDALTGLANHGYFWSALDREVERARRYHRQLSVAMIDVDHFKQFNDRYGHVAGDEALEGIAGVIRDWSRVHDFPSRYGGEEFALILPETELAGSVTVAEKFRSAVAASGFAGAEAGCLTISVGVAAFPDDAEDVDGLVEVADARLYRAKAGGRDRVCSEG